MARKKLIIRCGCRRCTAGLHAGWGFEMVKSIRKLRHHTKRLLKLEKFDDAQDLIVSCAYTD
jgi:hypothetical protein